MRNWRVCCTCVRVKWYVCVVVGWVGVCGWCVVLVVVVGLGGLERRTSSPLINPPECFILIVPQVTQSPVFKGD